MNGKTEPSTGVREMLISADDRHIGYIPALFIWCPLPYKNVGNRYDRMYGIGQHRIHLQMISLTDIGIPYSKKGRQVLSLITSQAVLGKSRHIELGDISEVWLKLHFTSSTGGKNGNIKRITDTFRQFSSLALSSTSKVIKCTYKGFIDNHVLVADKMELYWNTSKKDIMAHTLFSNFIDLSERFYDIIVNHAVPIDIIAYNRLQSPRKQDIYAWLVRRLFNLKEDCLITWDNLYPQFSDKVDPRKKPEFRNDFKDALFVVKRIYPDAKIQVHEKGILLAPSVPYIDPRKIGYI